MHGDPHLLRHARYPTPSKGLKSFTYPHLSASNHAGIGLASASAHAHSQNTDRADSRWEPRGLQSRFMSLPNTITACCGGRRGKQRTRMTHSLIVSAKPFLVHGRSPSPCPSNNGTDSHPSLTLGFRIDKLPQVSPYSLDPLCLHLF